MKKLLPLLLLTITLSSCASRVERIEDRQSAHTSTFENRQDRYDARYQGRTDRRQIRSDHADARFNARYNSW